LSGSRGTAPDEGSGGENRHIMEVWGGTPEAEHFYTFAYLIASVTSLVLIVFQNFTLVGKDVLSDTQ